MGRTRWSGAPQEALPGQPVTQEDVDWAQVILGNVPAAMLHGSPALEWLQTNSAGVEPYIQPGVLAGDTLLTNATGAYGLAIAEHMLGMLLMLFKKLDIYHANQEKQLWHMEGKVRSLAGAKVVVVGLGDIGGEFAKRVKALGGYVIGVRRADARKPEYADELVLAERLDEVLPVADVVAVCLPGTEHTRNLINRERIGLMKKDAVLMNVGRGFVVDTEALCDALESGSLGGACLDVTEPEPLPAGHRLWTGPAHPYHPPRRRTLPPSRDLRAGDPHCRGQPGQVSAGRETQKPGGLPDGLPGGKGLNIFSVGKGRRGGRPLFIILLQFCPLNRKKELVH